LDAYLGSKTDKGGKEGEEGEEGEKGEKGGREDEGEIGEMIHGNMHVTNYIIRSYRSKLRA